MSKHAYALIPEGFPGGGGVATGWSLFGPASALKLAQKWEQSTYMAEDGSLVNLDPKLLPTPPEPGTALKRAVEVLKSDRIKITKIADVKAFYISEGYIDDQGYPKLKDPRYLVSLINDGEACKITTAAGVATADDTDAEKIRREYDRQRNELSHTEFSAFLTRCVRDCYGVGIIRKEGGFYFIPPKYVGRWRAMVNAIHASSRHEIGEIPATSLNDVLNEVLKGYEREMLSECSKIQDVLDRVVAGDKKAPGVRGLISNNADIDNLKKRMGEVEGILGTKCEAALRVLDKIKVNLKMATDFAVAKAEGRKVDADTVRFLDLDDRQFNVLADDVSPGAEERFAGIGAEVGPVNPPVTPPENGVNVPAVTTTPSAPPPVKMAPPMPPVVTYPHNMGKDEYGADIWLDAEGERVRPLDMD